MIRALTMNNLTLIILVSFSVINILYMASDLFVKRVENASKHSGDCRQEEPDLAECQKCNEFLSCQGQTNEKIVRQTKTSTKSKILGNGDLVEQTTVTEVIETITHTGIDEDGSEECSDETTNSYYECLETCNDKWKGREKEKDPEEEKDICDDIPVVPFGCKPTENVDDVKKIDAVGESESEPFVEKEKCFEQLIPNSTSVDKSSDLSTPDDNLDISEEHKEEDPPPPHIKMATGLQCCLSRLVTSAIRSWTFYLSGLIRDIPLYCTDRCLYTRDNDSTSYCFSGDKSSSCITNITSLMRVHQYDFRVELDDLKTKEDILAESRSVPVMKLNTKKRPDVSSDVSCCPVKQVFGDEDSAGLFVLRGKTPDRRDHCSDNCIYVKVGDIKQTRYCFGTGDLGTACHQKVPSISTLLNTNTTFKQRPLRIDKVVTKSHEQNSHQSENPKILIKHTNDKDNSRIRDEIKANTKIDEKNEETGKMKMNTKKDDKKEETTELKRNTKQDEKIEEIVEIKKKTKRDEKTEETDEIRKNTKKDQRKKETNEKDKNTKRDEKKDRTDEIRKNTKSDEKKEEIEVLIPLLLKNDPVKLIEDEIPVAIDAIEILDEKVKENIKMKVFIHNGIRIRKMPKQESVLNSTNVDNKTEMKTVNISKTKKDNVSFSLKLNATKSSANGSVEVYPEGESTVLVFSKKCSTGVPMKLRKIEKQEEPLSIKKNDDNDEVFEEPLKISRLMRLPVKLSKLSETPVKTEPKKEINFEKDEVSNKCNKKPGTPVKSLRLPYQLGKNETLEQNNSRANDLNKQKNESIKSVNPNGKTAINSTLSSEETSDSPNVKNDARMTTGHMVYKLNKTRADLPSNETGKKVEKKNRCTKVNDQASAEGKRTLPYRITLPERPKLINRKKDSDDSVKAEIPIQIACCTGKPYKLKTVQKKNSEPVKIENDLPEPKGFAPVKLMGGDSVLEI